MRSAFALVLILAAPVWSSALAQDAQRAANTGQRFTLADLDDITEYLNRSHYRLTN